MATAGAGAGAGQAAGHGTAAHVGGSASGASMGTAGTAAGADLAHEAPLRVFAVSDVHTDYAENLAWVEQLSDGAPPQPPWMPWASTHSGACLRFIRLLPGPPTRCE